MLRLRNLFSILAIVIGISISAYAAITPITETEFGVSNTTATGSIAPDGSSVDDGCGVNTLPSAYGTGNISCVYNNAKEGRGCISTTYCKNGSEVTIKECPSTLRYSITDTSGLSKLSSLEYCDGYRDGVKAIYFYENPDQCSIHGITNATYLSSLNAVDTCDASATAKSCVNADGDMVNYCELSSTTGYQRCPSSNASYSPYPHSCGASSDGDAIICYIECGDGIYCAGYTCDISNLPSCAVLEEEKIAEGYYSSGISDYYDEGKGFIHQCSEGGDVKYMGFYCQGYYTQADCTSEANNGTVGNSCSYATASGNVETVYECTCGTWQTLSEYCNNNASCMSITTGYGNPCWLDSAKARTRAVPEPRYASFRSADQLCSVYNTDYVWSTSNVTSEYPTSSVQCYINEGDATTTTAYLYCGGCYKTSTEMQTICDASNGAGSSTVSSTTICTAQTAGNPAYDGSPITTYCGCDCDTNKFKTVDDWCAELLPDDVATCKLQAASAGTECHTRPKAGGAGYHSDDTAFVSAIKCSSNYLSKEDWCAANNISDEECNSYVGYGKYCKIDAIDDTGNQDFSLYKYEKYVKPCSSEVGSEEYIKDTIDECKIGENSPAYTICYKRGEDGFYNKIAYDCACPFGYGTTCNDPRLVRGGDICKYDRNSEGNSIIKYANCNFACHSEYAKEVSDTIYDCPSVGAYTSYPRLSSDGNYAKCTDTLTDRSEKYICSCPSIFMTIEQYCEANFPDNTSACKTQYKGVGTPCLLDLAEGSDTSGNDIIVWKYASFAISCPTDVPLYYSSDDCTNIHGVVKQECIDVNGVERVVCGCPTSYWSTEEYAETTQSEIGDDGEEIITVIPNAGCPPKEIDGIQYKTEATGEVCDFEGENNLRYKECAIHCSAIVGNSNIVVPYAYTYVSADNQTPTQTLCNQTMGNGAVLGFDGQAFCSLNNTKMYPCYCPAGFQECKSEDNLMAAENATICKVNGITYYSDCIESACDEESYNVAIVDTEEAAKSFGPGAEIVKCSQNGTSKYQVTCNASTYNDSCEYPYTAPKDYASVTDASSVKSWCKYSKDKSKKMATEGVPHFKSGACSITKTLGECGKSIAQAPEGANYTIFVASTESECTSKYGPGIKTQLCEYGKEQGYKRAYNCYYNPADFKYTTANCGVRHNLSGNYIIIKGKKYWNECKCTSAYQHHKFNCGGMLSGNPCQQEITQSMIDSDSSLKEAVADGYDLDGVTLPYYPYCECSSDYTEICDEDGSGRYKGVGTACNGKYTACECVPDKLPDNWTDNYYGCPGGKKPTGVWKDNGCGKKYYQCTVVECTWEYTEMCEAPLIPVGQSCQDNEGNIGGYKACTCPSDYVICGAGQVGEGEPCNLKGVSYYKSCKSQETCNSLSTETCTGPLQIGVNPCTRDDITYFESCVCANGYDKICGEGEVGVGNYCEIDGTKYYKECVEPEDNECTEKHVTACDTNQESYSPCVGRDANGKQIVKYLCRCPTNWQTCSETGPAPNSEKCTFPKDGTTYYSKCDASEGCSPYQDLTYKVCTSAQTGDGGSCSSTVIETINGEEVETTVIKHATCKDSGNCLTNGFRYSCSGYDTSALGESCIDDQGNKLYKECPCPSNYVSCGNSNATKGSKCTPLKSDGTFGPTVYSSCMCDKSKYKYTCTSNSSDDPYNLGITPPSGNNKYCETEEQVYVYTTDEDGNRVIKTDEDGNKVTTTEKVKYYSSCDCKSDYRYTCNEGENGAWLPDEYKKDYCKINSTILYKGCGCNPSIYRETEVSCKRDYNAIPDATGICKVRGMVSFSENSAEDGITSTIQTDNSVYYKYCKCGDNYKLDCDGKDQSEYGLTACTANGTLLWSACKCDANYSLTCEKIGLNQGIQGKASTLCKTQEMGNSNIPVETSYYGECECANGYEYTCEGSGYIFAGAPYCDVGNGKKYKSCMCDGTVFDIDKTISEDEINNIVGYCNRIGGVALDNLPTTTHCKQIDEDGNERLLPNKNLCCFGSSVPAGYILIDGAYQATSLSELLDSIGERGVYNIIAEKCGHGYNGNLAFDCNGKVYYKCADLNVKNTALYTNNVRGYLTKDECTALSDKYVWGEKLTETYTNGAKDTANVSTVTINSADTWKGTTITLKNACDCSSLYNIIDTTSSIAGEEDICVEWRNFNTSKLFCTSDTDFGGNGVNSSKEACRKEYYQFYPNQICRSRAGYNTTNQCVCKRGSRDYEFTCGDSSCRITNYCDDPYKGDNTKACWVNMKGQTFRVSTISKSGTKTYNCPLAYRENELKSCSGSGTGGDDACSTIRPDWN